LAYTYTDNTLRLNYNGAGADEIVVDSSGKLGLGTSSPQAALDIFTSTGPYFRGGSDNTARQLVIESSTTTNAGDTHTFRASSNTGVISFANSINSERLRIDSSGNLGLGTSSPRRQFHVHNSASATVGLMLTNGNTGASNDSQGFQLKVASDSHAQISQMENSHIGIFTNASERLRITSGGNVGIGTSIPDQKLHIEGSSAALQIQDSSSTNSIARIINAAGSLYIQSQNNTSHGSIIFRSSTGSSTAERLRIDSSGNTTLGYAGASLYFKNGFNNSTSRIQNGGGSNSSNFKFLVNNSGSESEAMRIDASGNVGIGTVSADRTLHVRKDGAAAVKFGGENGGDYAIEIGQLGSSSSPGFNATGGSSMLFNMGGSEKARIDASGNVGLGTSSFTATSSGRQILELNGASSSLINLDVGGARQAFHSADGTDAYSYNTANGSYIFGTNDTERMRIDSNGHFRPATNNTYDLGTSSYRWRNVYTNDLNLSNEGSANDVDGTWGNFTIQEGEDDLFLINRRSGKKYKFNLTEVN
jgi:hypothetical protein